MGLLKDLTAALATGASTDAALLRDLVSATVTSDGSVDSAEHLTVEALYETLPQLRAADPCTRPPSSSRKGLLATLAAVADEHLRKQLFVVAVDLALASEGASEREDVFIGELVSALRLDEAFAKSVIVVVSHKYGRARP